MARAALAPLHFVAAGPQVSASHDRFPAEPGDTHRDLALRVAGAVVAYRLHDVGYALDLERAARLVERQAPGRLRPTRGEAKALVIAQPPLTLALGPPCGRMTAGRSAS